MLAYDKARKLEEFLKKSVPKDHTIELYGTANEMNWREHEFRPLPPDPRHQELGANVKYYLYRVSSPAREYPVKVWVAVDALSNLAPDSIWKPHLDPMFPL